MAAGRAMLQQINRDETLYDDLALITAKLEQGFQNNLDELGLKYTMNRIGSMISLFFTEERVSDFETAKTTDTQLFGKYFRNMLEEGVYLPPSQFESLFISRSITTELANEIIEANKRSLERLVQ